LADLSVVDRQACGSDAAVAIDRADHHAVTAVQAHSGHSKHSVGQYGSVIGDVSAEIWAVAAGYELYAELVDCGTLVAHEQADLCLFAITYCKQVRLYVCYRFGLSKYLRSCRSHVMSSYGYVGRIDLGYGVSSYGAVDQLHGVTRHAGSESA